MKQLKHPEKSPRSGNRPPPPYPKHRKSDILWKVVMEEVFDDLLRFIFPDADQGSQGGRYGLF
jgi:hypothetical protein